MSGDLLCGRDAEVEAIAGTLNAVALGGQRLLAVGGEAGIGKTRLLLTLSEHAAAQRFVVLEARATELEHDAPLVPIIDALESRLPDADVLASLGHERLALIGAVFPRLEAPGALGAQGSERWRLYRALGGLLELIATDRPLLLLVDDFHWADTATQELVEHFVRRPPIESLLIAVGARPGAAAEQLVAAQRSGAAMGLVALDLRPLERDAVEGMLETVATGTERDELFAQSGGNPLLLRELARDGARDAVPGGILAMVRLEVAALPPAAQALLEAASVAGDPFDLDLAAGIAALAAPVALGALDLIVQRGLARATEDPRASPRSGCWPRDGQIQPARNCLCWLRRSSRLAGCKRHSRSWIKQRPTRPMRGVRQRARPSSVPSVVTTRPGVASSGHSTQPALTAATPRR
jgi:predicted ATPase